MAMSPCHVGKVPLDAGWEGGRLPSRAASTPSRVVFRPGVKGEQLVLTGAESPGQLAWDCPDFKAESPASQDCPRTAAHATGEVCVGAAGGGQQGTAAASAGVRTTWSPAAE